MTRDRFAAICDINGENLKIFLEGKNILLTNEN